MILVSFDVSNISKDGAAVLRTTSGLHETDRNPERFLVRIPSKTEESIAGCGRHGNLEMILHF